MAPQTAEGETYDGEWRQGLRHGVGTIHRSGTVVYQGEFLGDLRDGVGDGVGKDGSRYVGQWREGKMHGRGHMYEAGEGGQDYEGEWERGVVKEVYSRSGPPPPSDTMAGYESGRQRMRAEGSEWSMEGTAGGGAGRGGGGDAFDLHDIAEAGEGGKGEEEADISEHAGEGASPQGTGRFPAIPHVPGWVKEAKVAGAEREGDVKREEMVDMSVRHNVKVKSTFDEEGRYLPPVSYDTMREWHALNLAYTTEQKDRRQKARPSPTLVGPPQAKALSEPGYRGGSKTAKEALSYKPRLVDAQQAGPGEFSFTRWRQERGLD